MQPVNSPTTLNESPCHGHLDTPFGPIGVHWGGDGLIRVDLTGAEMTGTAPARRGDGSDQTQSPQLPATVPAATPVPDWIASELTAYFTDPRHRPACRHRATGTAFQQRVWAAIAAIPTGTTRTYAAIAADLGSAPRAVGGACRANPLPLLVPCHRVVARHGLGGFAGADGGRLLAIKRWLLRHEGVALGR